VGTSNRVRAGERRRGFSWTLGEAPGFSRASLFPDPSLRTCGIVPRAGCGVFVEG